MPVFSILFLSILIFLGGCDASLIGDNTYGQLGVADTTSTASTVDVGTPWAVMQVARQHSCGITTDNRLWCWGDNGSGEIGNGTMGTTQEPPTLVGAGATGWQQVAPSANHTCGLRENQLWCWGGDSVGQLGNGDTTVADQSLPVRVGTFDDWIQVESGYGFTCGIRNDNGFKKLYCWGGNNVGQLGIGTTTHSTVPQRVFEINNSQWTQVSAGFRHTCALNEAGDIYCWGRNRDGELGTMSYELNAIWDHPLYPVTKPTTSTTWKSVSAGGYFTCAISNETQTDPYNNSELYCWGTNADFRIKINNGDTRYREPTLADFEVWLFPGGISTSEIYSYSSVSAGRNHWCGITTGLSAAGYRDGEYGTYIEAVKAVRCKGNNDYGQTNISGNVPSYLVAQPISLSSGFSHTAVLTYEPQ